MRVSEQARQDEAGVGARVATGCAEVGVEQRRFRRSKTLTNIHMILCVSRPVKVDQNRPWGWCKVGGVIASIPSWHAGRVGAGFEGRDSAVGGGLRCGGMLPGAQGVKPAPTPCPARPVRHPTRRGTACRARPPECAMDPTPPLPISPGSAASLPGRSTAACTPRPPRRTAPHPARPTPRPAPPA